MKTIYVLTEGQSEEQFIKRAVYPHLLARGAYIIPVIVKTKIVKDGPNHKGGVTSYQKVKNDLSALLKSSNATSITTMIDYYKLPSDFPDFEKTNDCYTNVANAEAAFKNDINNIKFIPYIQLHEFEALLFTSPEAIVKSMGNVPNTLIKLKSMLNEVNSPEEINNGEETHPSKRLQKIYGNYNKPFYGNLIASRIGIEKILEKCPHFNGWINTLSL